MPHAQQSFCPDDPGGTKEQPRRIPFCSLLFDTNPISLHLIEQVSKLTNSPLLHAAPQLKGFQRPREPAIRGANGAKCLRPPRSAQPSSGKTDSFMQRSPASYLTRSCSAHWKVA